MGLLGWRGSAVCGQGAGQVIRGCDTAGQWPRKGTVPTAQPRTPTLAPTRPRLGRRPRPPQYMRGWQLERSGFEGGYAVAWYPAQYLPEAGSIFAVGDLTRWIPDEEVSAARAARPA